MSIFFRFTNLNQNEDFLKKIIRSNFLRNLLPLISGNVLSQAIILGTAPILTRLFTPENFGLLALFTAITGTITKISSFCYERAIVLPKENSEAKNILFLSLTILLSTTVITFVLVPIIRNIIVYHFDIPDFAFWAWFIPFFILLSGFVRIMNVWRIRTKDFNLIALAIFSQTVTSATIKIFFGFLIGAYAGGLIFGLISGTVISSIILLRNLNAFKLKSQIQAISKNSILSVAKKYKKFPYFATWNAALNTFSIDIVVIILSAFYTTAIVGFYSLGTRLLRQPILLVSESVQNVYFQKSASELANHTSPMKSLIKVTIFNAIVGLGPFLLLATVSKYAFGIVFGQKWAIAGLYVQIMAPWYYFLFVIGPSNVIFEIYQKQDLKLILSITKAALRCSALIVGYKLSKNVTTVLLLLTTVNVLLEITTMTFAFIIVKKNRGL